jgi:hypothetical protein
MTIETAEMRTLGPPRDTVSRSVAPATTVSGKLPAPYSMPGAQGFGAHFDPRDVFILRVKGSKTWLFRRPVPDASPAQAPWDAHGTRTGSSVAANPTLTWPEPAVSRLSRLLEQDVFGVVDAGSPGITTDTLGARLLAGVIGRVARADDKCEW